MITDKNKNRVMVVPPPGFKQKDGSLKRLYSIGGQPWVINAFNDQAHMTVALDFLEWWYLPATQLEFAKRGGNPCVKAGDEKGKKFIPIKFNSHHFSRQIIITNGYESPADTGSDHVPSTIGHEEHHGNNDIVNSFITIKSKTSNLRGRGMETLSLSCDLEVRDQPHYHKMDCDGGHGKIKTFDPKGRGTTTQSGTLQSRWSSNSTMMVF
jgi:hypothetical protein